MEIVHVVAINPYRKGNKGKVFSYCMDTYDKVIESAAVKKMIQQIRGELPIDGSIHYLHNFGTVLAMDVVHPRYLVGHLSKGRIVRLFPGR